ncbi:ABC transporter transmembrane domain-containing protein [Salinarimonas soli]|uniref:ABC transporter ATP-binding protein n=1 Tax=Salinarimonas soli TaxID=1638099 RepID=A0A5B2VBJ7_9HYPH|nr:ABC transporter ATP-binding protein/permease [Salinarimonas soli]KAA2235547.1 ABC transporter ATP-binding protein [Salinarimonas soli]
MDQNLFRYVWRHTRRSQILILGLILLSLPTYFLSFEIPKRIINEAIQGRPFVNPGDTVLFGRWVVGLPELLGGASLVVSPGFPLDQTSLLFALSGLFLGLVIVNGAFKYVINVQKGILGERMLRRMRYELFALLMRFGPEDLRAVKPAEAATIIKDEVEPIGGFTGDAFIQPAFLGTQALTALVFIMVQNVWLGLVALAVVLIQAFVIPGLRREQLRLGRERQLASRQLAGRIGEIVDGAPAILGHGARRFVGAEIGDRLGALFRIRVELFRRKFAVKYLNNLLAQVTPFFFYAIGGYLALRGSLDIGQLVAAIGAYRDLPPPIKELIDWDQQRADVIVKYEQIVAQFPAGRAEAQGSTAAAPPSDAPLAIEGLRVLDGRGMPLLESLDLVLSRPSAIALAGPAGSGRDILPKVLGRQVTADRGRVRIGEFVLTRATAEDAARVVAYAGSEPHLFGGTLRDNLLLALRRAEPALSAEAASPEERWRRLEAERSGNPLVSAGADWIDGTLADGLDARIMAALAVVGLRDDVRRLGLSGQLDPLHDRDGIQRVLAARRDLRERVASGPLARLIEPFDPERFAINATLGENLLFGRPTGQIFAEGRVAADPFVRSILQAEALQVPLLRTGLRMAETALEIFAGLPPGSPLTQRFSFIRSDELPDYRAILELARQRRAVTRLPPEAQARLIELALSYVEPRHRMGLVDAAFAARTLRARRSISAYLPQAYAGEIEFYDPRRYLAAASIHDNLLLGRIAYGIADAEVRVRDALAETLRAHDLEGLVDRVGLATDVGPGGRSLYPPQRAAVAIARCLLGEPQVLVLDGALTSFGPGDSRRMMASLLAAMAGRTLIATVVGREDASGFDRVVTFEGPRLSEDRTPSRTVAAVPEPESLRDEHV